jgi:hypothetical protein
VGEVMSHHFFGFSHFGHGPDAGLVLLIIAVVALVAIVKKESSNTP